MFIIHGCLFEDGQVGEQIYFADPTDELNMAEKVNILLNGWFGIQVELAPSAISKLLKFNGEM